MKALNSWLDPANYFAYLAIGAILLLFTTCFVAAISALGIVASVNVYTWVAGFIVACVVFWICSKGIL